MKIKTFFLFYFLLSTFIFFTILLIHFKIYFLPVIFFIIGFGIRIGFRTNYLIVFSFLFPLISAFASLENKGFPFNYLLLPLIVLLGIYIGEFFLSKEKALQVIDNINKYYMLLLSLIFISFFFVLLKWSNLTLFSHAFFRDTPIAPRNIRVSFGIIFPLIYFISFNLAYIYFLYLKRIECKKKIVIAFLFGHSLSIVYSLIQNFFKVKLFSAKLYNGFASDKSAFGFLCTVSLLLSLYIYYKYGDKFYGILFFIFSIFGIVHYGTRIGLITIFFVILYFFFKSKKRTRLIFIIILFIGFCNFIYFVYNPKISGRFIFLEEIRNNIENVQKYAITGKREAKSLRNLLAGRELLWDYSVEIIKKYPLSGVGVGNFVFWVMYNQFGKGYFHDLPNNQYLFFSSSIGIIGLLVFLTFLYSLWIGKKGIHKWIFSFMLVILFFGNYLWFPETFLAFWLVSSLGDKSNKENRFKNKKTFLLFGSIMVVFISSNIYHFNSLHPKNWAKETETKYEYGLWYKEKDSNDGVFYWTKKKSGIYVYLNKKGRSENIRLVCGAPLQKLKGKEQRIDIYWKGKFYKKVIFRENRDFVFSIKDIPNGEGFLEMIVYPTFNLKELGLTEETRDLGVQLYFSKEYPNLTHNI